MSETWKGEVLSKTAELSFTPDEYDYLIDGEYLSRLFVPFTTPKELYGFFLNIDDLSEWLEEDVDELEDEEEIAMAQGILDKITPHKGKDLFIKLP